MTAILIKEPKQARSKALVHTILETTTELLLSHGMKELTTNLIAQQSGVNIASLYQYFPNKESIVAKLIERHVDEEIQRITAVMTEVAKESKSTGQGLIQEKNIRKIIKEFIDVHTENLQLTQLLHMQVSHLACRHMLQSATLFLSTIFEKMLDKEGVFKGEDNTVRAYIITQSIDSLVQTTLIEHPDLFVKPVFLEELVQLSMRYLLK